MLVWTQVRALTIALFFSLCVSGVAFAIDTKVVVIPMGGDAIPPQNVIVVAKKHGDFSDPIKAIGSINDASDLNPYLIYIAPGVYSLTSALQMKPFVHITGSGRYATKLTGSISTAAIDARSAIVSGANDSGLSDIMITNEGGGGWSIALYNGSASPTIQNVILTADGGSINTGLYNNNASPTVTSSTISVKNGNDAYGIYNVSSSNPIMMGLEIEVSGGSTVNYGVRNNSSSPHLADILITVTGGGPTRGIGNFNSNATIVDAHIEVSGGSSSNYGIRNSGTPSPIIRDTFSKASGTSSYGVYNESAATPIIENSWLEGAHKGVINTSGTQIVNTRIIGGVVDTSGTQCLGTYKGDLTAESC